MIQIKELKKYYGRFHAVDGISFRVSHGEILGFLGPNGAGKTTTMKVIASYYPPTDGKVIINGMDVVEQSLETRKLIGYLPESNPLYHDLTVYEYLEHVSEIRQIPKDQRIRRIKEMCEITGITDRLGQIIGQLSKGFKQRVGLAQAMLHDPKILILDEPTIGLDPNQIIEIRSLIKRLGQEKTVILSTHILPEVQATCDRVIIINKGRLVADGTPDDLQHQFEGQPVIELFVTGEGSEDVNVYRAVPGVSEVERMKDPEPNVNGLRLIIAKGSDPRPGLFRMCVDKGWTLYEMHRRIKSLESIFHQLTQIDPAEKGENAA